MSSSHWYCSTASAMSDLRPRRDSLERFRAEILREAFAICHGKVMQDLSDRRTAHLCGVLATKENRPDLAVAYLRHAIRLGASCPELYGDLADALWLCGRRADSTAAYLRALTLAPNAPDHYEGLGRVLHSQQLYAEAEAVYGEALRLSGNGAHVAAAVRAALGNLRWKQ